MSDIILTQEQIKRYARQLIMPEIGGKGQVKLLKSKAIVVGAGGLGSAAIQYLAGAGVGKIGIVDGDSVDITNLQRQTIHAGNLGMNKAESAAKFVKTLNPDVEVEVYPENVNVNNVRDIIREYDVVVDCTDNFPSRFLLNDACVMEKIPLVHSAVLRFIGEIMTIVPDSACYRCVFPEAPPPGSVPSCQEAGIAGVATGIFGVMQATEAIKLILGLEILENKMLYADLLTMEFDLIDIRKDRNCPVCSGKVKDLQEESYVETCRIE
jgi:molybdopterin/thiamine biosynthesis adenylyltransferase